MSDPRGRRPRRVLDSGCSGVGNGRLFVALGAGIPVDGVLLPLVFDAYTQHALFNPNRPPLGSSFGLLDADGRATPSFTLPPASDLRSSGVLVYHA